MNTMLTVLLIAASVQCVLNIGGVVLPKLAMHITLARMPSPLQYSRYEDFMAEAVPRLQTSKLVRYAWYWQRAAHWYRWLAIGLCWLLLQGTHALLRLSKETTHEQ